jgi:hypothetical protein
MSTAPILRIPKPIEVWGLDKPYTQFHAQTLVRLKDVRDMGNGVSIKFFEEPIYMQIHGVVRSDVAKYGKYTIGIEPDEIAFFRHVERDVMQIYDSLTSRVEPNSFNPDALLSSPAYESLIKAKLSKTAGFDKDGNAIFNHDGALVKGAHIRGTFVITGCFHSPTHKGLVTKLHSYMLV